jgi:glycosyltransferase involved in cell wall biosynthesis
MPVYNGEKFVDEAIRSILCQSYLNFEFLIINDGSTDKTEDIVLSYQDKRIRYVKNEKNIRLIATLNKGLDLSRGKYIARMDADDISLPNRLEKQVSFLERNLSVGLLGTWVKTIGQPKESEVRFKQGNEAIRLELLFHNYFHHPTVMIRANVLRENKLKYPSVLHAEDYAFWLEIAKYTQLEILPEILVFYRTHEENISKIHEDVQANQTDLLRKKQLDNYGIRYTETELSLYFKLLSHNTDFSESEFGLLISFLKTFSYRIHDIKTSTLKAMFHKLLMHVYFVQNNEAYLKLIKQSSFYPSIFSRISRRFFLFTA